MNILDIFCRQVRARSDESKKAIKLLHDHGMPGQVVSILRQELDSFVRVIYLLSIKDRTYRNQLLQQSVDGNKWTAKDSKRRLTDREMVDLAQNLHGWTENTYRFGCAFIHLSRFHDYQDRDPIDTLSEKDNEEIREALSYYHGRSREELLSFRNITFYLPNIFNKVSSNLEHYVQQLENNQDLNEDDYKKRRE